MGANGGIIGVILSGVFLVAGIYVALKYSSGVQTIAKGATSDYGKVAKTFQGG